MAGPAGRASDDDTAPRPERPAAVPPSPGQDDVPAGEPADPGEAAPAGPGDQRSRLLDRLASLRALAASSRDAADAEDSPSSEGSGRSPTASSDTESTARVPGAVVAGCVLLVCALAAVPLLVSSGDGASGGKHGDSAGDVPPDVTVRYHSPGATNSPGGAHESGRDGSSHRPAKGAGGESPGGATDESGGDTDTTSSSGKSTASGGKNAKPASTATSPAPKPTAKADAAPSAAAAPAGRMIAGYASSRCIEISSRSGTDGSPLRLWNCDGDSWQKWVFKSDGSVRSMGLCMDAANAGTANGTRVQLATCNGGWAQQFNLNGSHDLVNTRTGKCVDAVDSGTGNGTRLQLWECAGSSNQKWYVK
ncbi:ricin-type beta-trefoil lectin domain protein [Streptomyces sp. NPDC001381]|uniref:ricin-type beta-trefoil lectin domain protein n=1 Tax=Streptomyces sp. NPDC001381 TaxID=3364567 RepID=UPI0036CDD6A3